MALTPNDVLNKQFDTTKFRDGYDQDQVDDFLDEVLAEFQRLIAENDGLKAQLGSAAASPAAAPAGDTGDADALRSQLAEAQSQLQQLQAQLAQTQTELEQAKQQAQQGGLDGMGSAEYLQLARRVHEEHVREGVAKRDQLVADGTTQSQALVAEAQEKADALVSEAQQRADGVVDDARTKADSLVSEAQEKADALATEAQQQYESRVAALTNEVSQLEQSKTALERNVSELQEFERNYRASLKSHLEEQLAGLSAAGTGFVPTTGATPTAETGQAFGQGAPTTEPVQTWTGQSGAQEEPSPEAGAEPSGEQIFDYDAANAQIPDFGTQRVDAPATDEQPSAPGFGGY